MGGYSKGVELAQGGFLMDILKATKLCYSRFIMVNVKVKVNIKI